MYKIAMIMVINLMAASLNTVAGATQTAPLSINEHNEIAKRDLSYGPSSYNLRLNSTLAYWFGACDVSEPCGDWVCAAPPDPFVHPQLLCMFDQLSKPISCYTSMDSDLLGLDFYQEYAMHSQYLLYGLDMFADRMPIQIGPTNTILRHEQDESTSWAGQEILRMVPRRLPEWTVELEGVFSGAFGLDPSYRFAENLAGALYWTRSYGCWQLQAGYRYRDFNHAGYNAVPDDLHEAWAQLETINWPINLRYKFNPVWTEGQVWIPRDRDGALLYTEALDLGDSGVFHHFTAFRAYELYYPCHWHTLFPEKLYVENDNVFQNGTFTRGAGWAYSTASAGLLFDCPYGGVVKTAYTYQFTDDSWGWMEGNDESVWSVAWETPLCQFLRPSLPSPISEPPQDGRCNLFHWWGLVVR